MMSETSAEPETATAPSPATATQARAAAGHGTGSGMTAIQRYASEYKTVIAASVGGCVGAAVGYVSGVR